MHTSMSSLFALVIALVNVASAQVETTSTASILLYPPVTDEVQGQVLGTGADGTTYRIYGTLYGIGAPFTATNVQDASQFSEVVALPNGDVSITLQEICSSVDVVTACKQEIIGVETTLSDSFNFFQSLTAVPILSGTEVLTLAVESTASASGLDSVSPPVISTGGTGRRTATVVSDVPSEATDADSGAERISGVVWALVLPVFVSLLVW